MDRRELTGEWMEVFLTAIRASKAEMWTAFPGIVEEVKLEQMTANVRPAIKALQRPSQPPDDPNFEEWVEMPTLLDCPIVYPSGGGYSITFPLAAGDEVLIIISSRCIDGWWELGGPQPQLDLRMHDLSDGFCLPGIKSKPRAGGVDATGMVLSGGAAESELGPVPASSIRIGADGVTVTSPTIINLNAPMVLVNGVPIP